MVGLRSFSLGVVLRGRIARIMVVAVRARVVGLGGVMGAVMLVGEGGRLFLRNEGWSSRLPESRKVRNLIPAEFFTT